MIKTKEQISYKLNIKSQKDIANSGKYSLVYNFLADVIIRFACKYGHF